MAQIDILMATYNGGSFLSAQLCSIIGQSFDNWRLLIHDDGSSDNTIEILRHYASMDSRIVFIDDGVKCGGAAANFLYLTHFVEAPYFMFCDQDDIWFDNKIEVLYKKICQEEQKIPIVVYSRSYVWMPSQGILGITGWHVFPQRLEHVICNNGGIQGCVAIANRKSLEFLVNYKGRVAMHDHLLLLSAISFGRIIPESLPLMLYRQHQGNVTGQSQDCQTIVRRLWRNFCIARPVVDQKHYEAVRDFFYQYRASMTSDVCKVYEAYLSLPRCHMFRKLIIVNRFGFMRNGSRFMLLIKILIHPYM